MCFWKKRVKEKPAEKEIEIETTDNIEEELIIEEKNTYLTPEELDELRRKFPGEFPFTPEWKVRVQAENVRKTLEDTGLIH